MKKSEKLETYLAEAGRAYTGAIAGIGRFATIYVAAVSHYGQVAKNAFAAQYPVFTARMWARIEQIGSGKLLPQLIGTSDRFVAALLRLDNSLSWQRKLVGATEDGKIRVDRGHGPVLVTLGELTAGEEEGVLSILSEADQKMSPEALAKRACKLTHEIYRKTRLAVRPLWICREDGRSVEIRITRPHTFTIPELEKMLREAKEQARGN